jgi:hypothetical protein
MEKVQNKTAIITGAGSGIGYSIAEELLRNDAKVIYNYKRIRSNLASDTRCGRPFRSLLFSMVWNVGEISKSKLRNVPNQKSKCPNMITKDSLIFLYKRQKFFCRSYLYLSFAFAFILFYSSQRIAIIDLPIARSYMAVKKLREEFGKERVVFFDCNITQPEYEGN